MLLLPYLFACTPEKSPTVTTPEETQTVIDSSSDSSESTDTQTTPPDTQDVQPKPCFTYNVPTQTGTIVDSELEELSDIVPSRKNAGVLWVHEDNGNPSVITAINSGGATLGSVTVEGQEMDDWEDMAMGRCDEDWCLWIGDIGNNQVDRAGLRLLEVPEPTLDLGGGIFELVVQARQVVDVSYPDGDHNAEALIWSENGPAILTKETDKTMLYTVDIATSTMTLQGSLHTSGTLTTAADLWPDESRLLIRTYTSLDEYWLSSGGLRDLAHSIHVDVPVAPEKQGEAASYDPVLRGYWTVSEGVNQPIYWAGCSSEAP